MTTYRVQRCYFKEPGHWYPIKKGLTLEEAQEHCGDPETSSSTCKRPENVERTKLKGPWFDAYTVEK